MNPFLGSLWSGRPAPTGPQGPERVDDRSLDARQTVRADRSRSRRGRRPDHEDVSRRHAYLQVIGGRAFFVDLGSRTGVACDDEPQRTAGCVLIRNWASAHSASKASAAESSTARPARMEATSSIRSRAQLQGRPSARCHPPVSGSIGVANPPATDAGGVGEGLQASARRARPVRLPLQPGPHEPGIGPSTWAAGTASPSTQHRWMPLDLEKEMS